MASDNQSGLQERITRLEEQVAHQNVTIEDLSQTISTQWNQLDKMRIKLDALTKRFLDLEEATAPAPENTKPPHY